MSARFEEIDWRQTPMGEISLRRRRDPSTGNEVYEVKLGDEYLMSSLFTAGEVALSELGLAGLRKTGNTGRTTASGPELDVVVGGLGLGYTADTVLADERVRSLCVVEALGEVVEWHRRGLVPLGERLSADPRCRLVQGDFFARAMSEEGFDPEAPGRRFDAVLLDIDHSPQHVLHPSHAPFYETAGLRALAEHLRPGGVFALWSNDPPSAQFRAVLAEVFTGAEAEAHEVTFANPLQGGTSANTVYVARTASVTG